MQIPGGDAASRKMHISAARDDAYIVVSTELIRERYQVASSSVLASPFYSQDRITTVGDVQHCFKRAATSQSTYRMKKDEKFWPRPDLRASLKGYSISLDGTMVHLPVVQKKSASGRALHSSYSITLNMVTDLQLFVRSHWSSNEKPKLSSWQAV